MVSSARGAIAVIPHNAANEIEALEKLVTLTRFASNKSVRAEEIQRQLVKANAMVPERSGTAAYDRFRAHEAALRKFLSGASTRDDLGKELGITQDFLSQGRP
jgi:hypothetical protein